MTSLLWSQESQQEKLEERKAQIQKKLEKMKGYYKPLRKKKNLL